jgi:hypothetical protein
MRLTWNWGTGIAVLYTSFALSTIGFVAFAMSRPVSLVSADYYEQSLREDAKREATGNALALGAQLSFAVPRPHRLEVRLPLDQVATARGTITFYRASDAAQDRVVALKLAADGTQSVPIGDLASGQWLAKMRWNANGRAFYVEHPVAVR